MNCRFAVIKLKKLIITVLIIMMLLYVAYVCYSVFFAEQTGRFI